MCGLLLSAGCRSTDLFSWGSRSGGQASNSDAGLPPPSQGRKPVDSRRGAEANRDQLSQNSVPSRENESSSAASDNIRVGREAVAQWYNDQRPTDLQRATEAFQRELVQNPRSVDAHHGLAIVADLKQDFVQAERHYQDAIKLRPTDARILGDMGYSCLLQNRLPDAELYLNRALVHDPNNQNAIKHLGDVYARKGDLEMARSTYRRVLNETQVAEALAEYAPLEDNRSLVDRLRNKPSEQQTFAQDLQRRFDERRAVAENQPAQSMPQGWPQREPTGEEIRNQLSRIDGERYQNVPDGPVVLGGRNEPIQRLPAATQQDGQWWQQPNGPMDGISVQGSRNTTSNEYQQNAGTLANVQNQQPNPAANAGRSDSSVDQLTRPWGQPVQPAAGVDSSGAVGSAYYQQEAPMGSENLAPQQPGASPNNSNGAGSVSYEEASKAAARMGMGFGPGTMFPMFQSATPSMMPGSNSMINGAVAPAPQRYLPNQPQPLDLGTQMQSPTTQYSPLQNQFGAQVPTSTPHMTQPGQIGTPQNYGPATEQSPGYVPQQFQMYDQQRQTANSDLGNATQNNRGVQMQYSPTSDQQGVSHASGQVILSPQGGQYMLPGSAASSPGLSQPQPSSGPSWASPQPPPANGSQPEQYPYARRNVGPGETELGSPGTFRTPSAGSSQTIQPESYRPRMNDEPNRSNSSSGFNTGGLPLITPSR